MTEEIERVLQQLQEQEIFNYQIVRDHVELMSQYEADERRLQEETEGVRQENGGLRDQIREISRQAETKKKEVRN